MTLSLRRDISFCLAGGQAVFLDLGRDRYFCLGEAAQKSFRALLDGDPAPDVQGLIKLNLVEPCAKGGAPIRPIGLDPVSRSLIEEPWSADDRRGGYFAEVAWTVAQARRRLRRRPFLEIIDELKARKRRRVLNAASAPEDLWSWSRRYAAARSKLPIKPVCLPEALSLLDFLARRDHFPDLVLGVKLSPFAAHCWLQSEGVALNEAIDTIAAHAPILVV